MLHKMEEEREKGDHPPQPHTSSFPFEVIRKERVKQKESSAFKKGPFTVRGPPRGAKEC